MRWVRAEILNSRRRNWKALIPAIAGIVRARSRCHWQKSASPLISCFFAVLLFAQAGSLPFHLGLLLAGPDAHAMTEGCDKKTCCTALCYLDKHGIHHCVHGPGDSCECGISTDDLNTNPLFLSSVVTLPELQSLIPDFSPTGWVLQIHGFQATRDIATPTPPPK